MDQFCSNICSLHNSAIVDACLLLMSKISMEGPDAVFAEKLCSVSDSGNVFCEVWFRKGYNNLLPTKNNRTIAQQIDIPRILWIQENLKNWDLGDRTGLCLRWKSNLIGRVMCGFAKWNGELAVFLWQLVSFKDDLARDVVRILKNGSVALDYWRR